MGSHRERVGLALARSFCFPNLIGLDEVIENGYELSHTHKFYKRAYPYYSSVGRYRRYYEHEYEKSQKAYPPSHNNSCRAVFRYSIPSTVASSEHLTMSSVSNLSTDPMNSLDKPIVG